MSTSSFPIGVPAASQATGSSQIESPPVHARFRALDEALRGPKVRVLSVDVFDTLLCRRVPKPTDAHYHLGRRLVDEGLLASHLNPRLFARLRILAEEEARGQAVHSKGTAEVTLREICALLLPAVTDRLSIDELAALELANERSLTFPDPDVVGYLQQMSAGVRLVAVSDTYFSADELRFLFEHHRIDALGFDAVYASSDWGAGKGSGLWDLVVRTLEVDAAAIVHAGDNEDADVSAAARAGVTGIHLPLSSRHFADVTVKERIVGDSGDPSPWCDERHGDGGLTAARRRATLLGAPIAEPSPAEQLTWETGTAILGPVLTGFAEWVHDRAADLGAERALCVMREGRFLRQLVDGAAGRPGHRLRTATVWASREGCARASIYEGSEEELRSFLSRLRTPRLAQVAASLGLDPRAVPELAGLLDRFDGPGADPRAGGEAIVELVLRRDELREEVVARSAARRHQLAAHLRRAAGPGAGPVMVVDVGWGGTILEALQRIADGEHDPLALHGLFVLAHIGSAGPLLRGVALEGYLGDSGDVPFDVAGVTGNPELVELACMCDEGTFLEMGEDGEPVLAPTSITLLQHTRRNLLQEGILAFQREWLIRRDASTGYETSAAGRAALRRILERFLSLPDREEVDAFGWWGHEENFGSETVDEMVPATLRPTLHLRTADSLHGAPPSELYWVGGAAALVDEETADAIFLMRRGLLGPRRVTISLDLGSAGIFLVGPDGFEELVDEVPLVANRRGATLVEWYGPAREASEVRIRPAQQPAILRIDWLELVSGNPGGKVRRYALGPDRQIDALRTSSSAALAPRTYAVDGRSRLGLAVPEHSGATITVTFAGQFLPLPQAAGEEWSLVDVGTELAAVRQELDALHRTKVLRAAAAPRRLYAHLRSALGRDA